MAEWDPNDYIERYGDTFAITLFIADGNAQTDTATLITALDRIPEGAEILKVLIIVGQQNYIDLARPESEMLYDAFKRWKATDPNPEIGP